MTEQIREWGAADAARHIRIPGPQDNKYTHGVLGVVTGSEKYPGAAVLGVEAAHRTGIGMVRFLGERLLQISSWHAGLKRSPFLEPSMPGWLVLEWNQRQVSILNFQRSLTRH